MKIKILKRKKSWEPFSICLLNSTAKRVDFQPNWAGLTVLFSRQILNGSQDFFLINTLIFIYFFEYETIETHASFRMPIQPPSPVFDRSVNTITLSPPSTACPPGFSDLATALQYCIPLARRCFPYSQPFL